MTSVVVLTPNPAVDVTYRVARQVLGETVRVLEVRRRAGGKGLNVAGVLAGLGVPATAVQPVAGQSGRWLGERLAARGVAAVGVEVAGETRTTVAVVDGVGHPTLYAEPGPELSAADWDRVVAAVAGACERGGVLVVSGSFPPATDEAAVAALVAAGHRAGCRVVVDTAGPPLAAAAAAGADVLKPNAQEAAEATGARDPRAAADELHRRSGGAVALSRGAEGLLAVAADGSRLVQPAVPGVAGNPVGAGDAATAGLVAAMLVGATLDEALRWAAVVGAAAVLRPVAGEVDPADLAPLAARLPAGAAPRLPLPAGRTTGRTP